MMSATSKGGRFTPGRSPAVPLLLELAQSDLFQRIDRGAQMAARQMHVQGGVF